MSALAQLQRCNWKGKIEHIVWWLKSVAIPQIPGWWLCSLFNSLHHLLDFLPLGCSALSPLRLVPSINAGVCLPSHSTTFKDLVGCDFISSCFPSLIHGCYYLLPFSPPGHKAFFQLIPQQDVSLIPFVPLLFGFVLPIETVPSPGTCWEQWQWGEELGHPGEGTGTSMGLTRT